MKIVLIGGFGTIGMKALPLLRARGHEVVAASTRTGVDIYNGVGLTDALAGAEVVFDLTNPPVFEDDAMIDFFVRSGRNLLRASKAAGVRHHIALSAVGVPTISDSGYFLAKRAQEQEIEASDVPYTIIRSAQFFELIPAAIDDAGPGDTISVSTAITQSVAADDVARIASDVCLEEPRYGVVEIAGVERFRLCDLVSVYLKDTGSSRLVLADANAPYFGAKLADHALVPSDEARLGSTQYAEWINGIR